MGVRCNNTLIGRKKKGGESPRAAMGKKSEATQRLHDGENGGQGTSYDRLAIESGNTTKTDVRDIDESCEERGGEGCNGYILTEEGRVIYLGHPPNQT